MFDYSLGFRNWFLKPVMDMLQQLMIKDNKIMVDLTALTTQVEQNTAVEASAVTLIQGLAKQIADSATDPAAIAALASKLNASATALAAAITANTPAVPPTV